MVSFDDAARAIEVTALTVRRMGEAEVGLRIPYVKELLRTYGVSGGEIEDFPRPRPRGQPAGLVAQVP
ncbi:hypothetical protein [Streptomyces stelliscabiei]|uniref:hypothetical protein n=1 Tax=Streptomyces stelliscabiei TaxID=146820 RepID=UPI002FF0450D